MVDNMTTSNNNTMNATDFLTFVNRVGIDNQNGLKRAERFNAEFKEYSLDDNGKITVTKHDDSQIVFSPVELFGRFQKPADLPNGNGKIDSALDGKSGENKKAVDTSPKVKYLQTSDDYLKTALIEHGDLLAVWEAVAALPATPKVADYAKMVDTIKAAMLPDEQSQTYAALVASEASTEELKKLGFVFGANSCYLSANNKKVYRGTIDQSAIVTNGKAIGELIETIGQPIAKTEGDLFAGTLKSVYEISFYLKSETETK